MQKTAVGVIAPETVCREDRFSPQKNVPVAQKKNMLGKKGNKKLQGKRENSRVKNVKL